MEKQKSIERDIIGKKLTFAQRLIQCVIKEKRGSVIRENIHGDYSDFACTEGSKNKSTYVHSEYADYAYNDASKW